MSKNLGDGFGEQMKMKGGFPHRYRRDANGIVQGLSGPCLSRRCRLGGRRCSQGHDWHVLRTGLANCRRLLASSSRQQVRDSFSLFPPPLRLPGEKRIEKTRINILDLDSRSSFMPVLLQGFVD